MLIWRHFASKTPAKLMNPQNKNNIPQGYKTTPLGIIPQEWEVEPLHYLGQIYSGGTPDTEVEEYWNGDIVWCTPSDITKLTTKYIEYTDVKITDRGLKESSATLLPPQSIVVCTRATIGNAAICTTDIATNQGFKNIIPNKETNSEWLYYMIIYSKPRLVRLGCGSTFLEVSKKDFSRFKILVPPLPEQQKIAEVLGTWDKTIEKQTQLIKKLELRKKGLMQQLLTGKKRLPGFSGEWRKVKLGKLFIERNEINKAHLPLLSITADRGVIFQSESDKRDISNDDKSKYKHICPNDIGYNTMRMWQGRCALSSLEGIVSPAYTIITPNKDINPYFMEMLFKQPFTIYCFWTHSQGLVNDTLNCKFPDFSQIKVTIPNFEEQNAISQFFKGINHEIELCTQKLNSLLQQKKGLMQVLLTGKKRVI